MTTYRPYLEDLVKPNLPRINPDYASYYGPARSQSYPLQTDGKRFTASQDSYGQPSAPVSAKSPLLALPDSISAPQTSLPELAAEVSKTSL
jgi:hypothetical protein